MKKYLLLLLSTILMLSVSCDNTLDLEAPYQEIGVIYGLINAADSVQYIRIQKAFLGKGNALEMAQIVDSTYYPDILDVRLHRIKNGTDLGSFPLTRFIGPDKVDGVFPSSPNILYKSNGETISRDSEYKIVVTNTQTGHVFYAQTPVVDSMVIIRPNNSTDTIVKWTGAPVKIEYVPTKNGKVYNLVIRFHFMEQDLGIGFLESKYIDWVVLNEIIENPDNTVTVRREIEGARFYEFVHQKLQPGNYLRYAGRIEFIFTTGEEFLANYINIHASATTSSITPPHYSNVIGGTGIFSSRFIQKKKGSMDQPSIDRLQTDSLTYNLGFQ